MKTICIYHENCTDGFAAAWVVRKALGDSVEFYPGVYSSSPPDVTDRDVILVDFSYKRAVIEDMLKVANSVTIIDHHKSAIEDLTPLIGADKFSAIFNVEHSGAGLVWKQFFLDVTPPALISHIEDRDLWKFALEGTREIIAALFSYPYTFETYDHLMDISTNVLRLEGLAIDRNNKKAIAELITLTKRHMIIGGHKVPVANLPHIFSSEAGHIMSKDTPFAACYWDTPKNRIFSLRSAPDGADVAMIAQCYGGGGHKHAAGFTAAIGWEGEKEFGGKYGTED